MDRGKAIWHHTEVAAYLERSHFGSRQGPRAALENCGTVPPRRGLARLGFDQLVLQGFLWPGTGVNSPQRTARRAREQAAPRDTLVLCLTCTRVERGPKPELTPGYADLAEGGFRTADTETVDPPEWGRPRTETVGYLISGDTALRSVLWAD